MLPQVILYTEPTFGLSNSDYRGRRMPKQARKTAARSAQPAAPAAGAPPRVGETIARLRGERGLTLEDLSRVAGVSKSMLSEIERDKANPTIAVAWRLANALGLGLDQLLSTGVRQVETLRVAGPHETPRLAGTEAGYTLRILGPMELAGRFEWYELTVAAGGALVSGAHDPGAQEHLTVLHGSLDVEVDGATRRLKVGDTARYLADRPHAIRNATRLGATGLLVVVHP
jgi:transcriptional regulator with XRE-family HTH domain